MPRYIFNSTTLNYEIHKGSRKKQLWRILWVLILSFCLSILYFWLYVSVFGLDLPKTVRLKEENALWKTRMAVLDRQLDAMEESVVGIEDRDDNVYRAIFGMNPISDAVKYSGLGEGRYAELEEMGAGAELKALTKRMDIMLKRVYVRSLSLDEVGSVANTAGDMVSHVPAVPPFFPGVNDVRITSPFGYRTDPVYGGRRFHSGQDFAAKIGTPVYATGDGVVVEAGYTFSGYGNVVVIDHGFGYRTRYAHLHNIDVQKGMKVVRGTVVGGIGNSGKATGPHLHYEVLFKGNAINPYSFMDLGMTAEEYQAMVDNAVSTEQ